MKNYMPDILNQLTENSKKVSTDEMGRFIEQIKGAKHIFLAGAGRSGVPVKGFANRLLHLGFSVSVVGEISAPRSKAGDLLLLCSGSGETGGLINLAKKAKSNNVNIALITTARDSSLGKLADVILLLPGIPKEDNRRDASQFSQPMGTSFEQLAFLTCDNMVLNLMDDLNETSATMFQRHTDLE